MKALHILVLAEEHRATFILYLRGEVFLRAALVRVKGEIAGYLNDYMGIIEYKDEKDKKINILFHTEDVKVFKKDLRELGKPAKSVLPVGCLVSVDARRVHVVGAKNIEYQVGKYCRAKDNIGGKKKWAQYQGDIFYIKKKICPPPPFPRLF